jgi:BirA family transcriptional regulator, biotin operon repressor / biotin---[acetyl-CoA-carboxylase] ligase
MDDALDAADMAVPGLAVHVLERCTSTNSLLLSGQHEAPCLLATEEQSAGRGRRGRRWHSAPGASATFSVARLTRRALPELAGLSLVAGVAVAQALHGLGARDTRLKWPNDLVVGDDKLGGILVETRSARGATLAVIGIGINCRESRGLQGRVRRGITWLERQMAVGSRNRVIKAIAQKLVAALDRFEAAGLEPTRAEWEALDALAGRRMRVRLADGRVLAGVASGLAEDGALRLRTARGMRTVRSATVVAARPLIMARP